MSKLAPYLFASFCHAGSGCCYSCCPSPSPACVACSCHVLSILFSNHATSGVSYVDFLAQVSHEVHDTIPVAIWRQPFDLSPYFGLSPPSIALPGPLLCFLHLIHDLSPAPPLPFPHSSSSILHSCCLSLLLRTLRALQILTLRLPPSCCSSELFPTGVFAILPVLFPVVVSQSFPHRGFSLFRRCCSSELFPTGVFAILPALFLSCC